MEYLKQAAVRPAGELEERSRQVAEIIRAIRDRGDSALVEYNTRFDGSSRASLRVTREEIDAVAVTYGPGLIGALLVAVNFAKSAALAMGKPLIPVHHLRGHIAANYIEHPDLEPPFVCLVVSGGHTHLVIVKDYGEFQVIGRTRDDAAGEAFDKVARAVGLGYPGGPKVDKTAREGDPKAIQFPRGKVEGSPYDFTFSGLKSCVCGPLTAWTWTAWSRTT